METLKEYIETTGLKQNHIADQLEITRQYLSEIVNGQIPSRKLALKIEAWTDGKITAPQLLFPE